MLLLLKKSQFVYFQMFKFSKLSIALFQLLLKKFSLSHIDSSSFRGSIKPICFFLKTFQRCLPFRGLQILSFFCSTFSKYILSFYSRSLFVRFTAIKKILLNFLFSATSSSKQTPTKQNASKEIPVFGE